MTIFVRSGRNFYDIHRNPYAVWSFETTHGMDFYSSADFFRLVRQESRQTEDSFFLLPDAVMKFFYEKDKPDLSPTGTHETGDAFTIETNTYFCDTKTGNTWTLKRCRGEGVHAINGSFYIFHTDGCIFQSV